MPDFLRNSDTGGPESGPFLSLLRKKSRRVAFGTAGRTGRRGSGG